MTPELKSIISEIAFPVRYVRKNYDDGDTMAIVDSDNKWLVHLPHMFQGNDAFGEELARLINTIDPKRESVSDKEIWDKAEMVKRSYTDDAYSG